MNQQDLTAQIDRIKISRRESLSRAYELYQDETTPQDLAGYVFSAQLTGPNFYQRTLIEGAGISRLNTYTVAVNLTAGYMASMGVGTYTLVLFGERLDQTEMIVQLLMQVEL